MDKFKELEALVTNMKDDVIKFYDKGNKSAGVRVRKSLQDIKAIAQSLRLDISAQKKD